MSATLCRVEGCTRQGAVLAKTICRTHYGRLRDGRRMDTPIRPIRTASERGDCSVPDCTHPDCGPRGLCAMHATRYRRHGSVDVVIPQAERGGKLDEHPRWTGDAASYDAMHQRVRSARGSASLRKCADCGCRASHWSYDREDSDERASTSGPYSTSLQHYVPRCVPCHKRFDLARIGGGS